MVPYIVDQKIILDSIAASTEVLIRFSFDATRATAPTRAAAEATPEKMALVAGEIAFALTVVAA
eukprot:CCRYP_014466-RA/>CCRYP_014466-RA protein AED:0.31 eAED:0.38 QI:955/0.5/0.66/1/0/0/3/0/63